MEHQKVLNLLNEASNSRFVMRTWNIVNDQSISTNYSAGNDIIYSTEVLKSYLPNYNNVHILVRGNITDVATPRTQVPLKFVLHSLNVSQKTMKQQQMVLKT